MKLMSIVLMLVFCGCGGAVATNEGSESLVQSGNTQVREWKLSGKPSVVYVVEAGGSRGARIELVQVVAVSGSDLSDDRAKDWNLIRVNGGDEETRGIVFLAEWKVYYDGYSYMTNIKGGPRNMLHSPQRKQETWEHAQMSGSLLWIPRQHK